MWSRPSLNQHTPPCDTVKHCSAWSRGHTGASKRLRHCSHRGELTTLATRSLRWRPYLATTGRKTSVTGLVGLAFSPTERLMGTRSNLRKKERVIVMVIKARNKKAESIKQWIQAGSESNLNKVLFSILSSRELRVRQSWSNTKG